MANVYNTNDPQKLLALKRLEADAMLDVMRSINHDELNIAALCVVARNVLIAQLGVRRMIFLYQVRDRWEEGMRHGFEALGQEALTELGNLRKTSPIGEASPALETAGVEYVVPIINRGQPKAYFLISEFADTEVEAQNDLIFIETLGSLLSIAIRNKELFQEKVEQEFLRKELEVAETIQKQLLISDFDRFREFDVHALNLAHHGVGGDFYDIIKKEKGTTFLCIADVSGKGIGAALLMSNLQANLRALCAQYSDLIDIVCELNRILYNITTGEKFVTLFMAKVDTQQKTITYVNAGHNYPVFIQGKEVQRLESGCVLLGIMSELTVVQDELAYHEGDLLLMFTDGVVEQHNAQDEMYGSDRLTELLPGLKDQSAAEIVGAIKHSVKEFAGGQAPNDDITLLGVKFL